jgi:CubicO group peptidase (beta-lactamase class C family)
MIKQACSAVLALALLGSGYGQSVQPSSDGTAKQAVDLGTKVAVYMKPILAINGFSGFVIVVKGGKVILSKGYGMANYEFDVPNTAQTKFHLASVSKTFTAAAIMQLEERGLLSVDDALTKFLPDYPNGNKIKIYHLLTNTSGIPNINSFPEYDTWSKFSHTPEDLIEKFKDQPLDFQPGGRSYTESNSNYNLLAFIIEKLSGKAYGEFLKENIFDPIGMTNTGHHGDPKAILKNRAAGYMPNGMTDFENAPYIDYSVKTGNGSIYSTAEDLYKWDRALYSEKVLKKKTIEKMFSGEYGWFNRKRFNHRAIIMNGRQPGFQCEIQRYVNDDVFILVLGNSYITTPSLMANDLAAMVFGESYEPPKIEEPVKVDAKVLDTYVGRYQFGPEFYAPNLIVNVENRSGQLYAGQTALIPQSDSTFFDRSVWAMLTFVREPEGRITHFIWRYGRDEYRSQRLGIP